jgi:quinol monooxygenase YgiN
MIIVSGQLYILPERREAVLVAAREMSQRTRLESGCISYAFSELLDESGGLRLFEEWTDADALSRHLKSESFASFSESIRTSLTVRPQFIRYEVANARPLFGTPGPSAADGELEGDLALGDIATKVLFENDLVRVWEMRLQPGESSAWHRHDLPYLLCIVAGASIDVDPKGRRSYCVPVRSGEVLFVQPGETERAVNRSQELFHEILIELKAGRRHGMVADSRQA